MGSADILNYALTVLVVFIIVFGIAGTIFAVRLLKVLTKLAISASLTLATMKTLGSGLKYSVYDILSKGLSMFTSKRR